MENKTPQEVLKLLLENWVQYEAGICSRVSDLAENNLIKGNEVGETVRFVYEHLTDALLKFNAMPGFFWWELSNQKDRLDFVKYLSEKRSEPTQFDRIRSAIDRLKTLAKPAFQENIYMNQPNVEKLLWGNPDVITTKIPSPQQMYHTTIFGVPVITDETIPDDHFIVTTAEGFVRYKSWRLSGLSHEETVAKFTKA